MIDLHTHTIASDGACTPEELVVRASKARLTVLSVTDHDTFGGCAEAAVACGRYGIEFVTGIEVTAVAAERDVHILGYFLDAESLSFNEFLTVQRLRRLDRVREMLARLRDHGIELDVNAVLVPGLQDAKKSAGRPWIARALVDTGRVPNVAEAFNRWLAPGRPGFVPRVGVSPGDVFERIHDAGGIASLAHPGLLARDEWIPGFVASGLDALEVHHRDHDGPTTAHYRTMATSLGLLVTGGSDYHADNAYGGGGPGKVTLPAADYARLTAARAARRATASGSPTSS